MQKHFNFGANTNRRALHVVRNVYPLLELQLAEIQLVGAFFAGSF
jgi:hypothetical protein